MDECPQKHNKPYKTYQDVYGLLKVLEGKHYLQSAEGKDTL